MNDLYIHQLETENKQIREQLQLCRNAINEIKEELSKTIDAKDKIIKEQVVEIARLKEEKARAIEYIKETGLYCDYGDLCNQSSKDLLEILEANNE